MLVAAVPARADDPAATAPADPTVVATTTDTAPVPPPPEVTLPPTTTDVAPAPVVPPAAPVAPTTTTAPTTATTPAPVPTVTTEIPPLLPLHHGSPSSSHAKPKAKTNGDTAATQGKKHNPHAHKKKSSATPTPFTRPATVISSLLLDSFRIPPFLLPIYQAAGVQYGIHWQVLAAINEIESDYGRNLNVSSAGALGWMQFMPSTWKRYGVDANGDGKRDPYNPVDAIFAAARYLKAAGGDTYIRQSIYAYNHAGWYVNSVLLRARLISALPDGLVSALTGLTQGRPPVPDPYKVQLLTPKVGVNIQAPAGAAAVAVQDGRVTRIGYSKRLGHFVQLVDVYGNTYTYGHLGSTSHFYPVPKPQSVTSAQVARELHLARVGAAQALHQVHHSAHAPTDPAADIGSSQRARAKPASTLAGDFHTNAATDTPSVVLHDDLTSTTKSDPAEALPSGPLPGDGPAPAATATPDAPLPAADIAPADTTATTPAEPPTTTAADGSASAPTDTTPADTTPADTTPADTTPAEPTTTATTTAPPANPATVIATQTATALPAVPLADDAGDMVSAVPRVALKGAADDATVWSLPGGDDGISEPILLGYDDKDRKSGAALLGLKQSQVSFEPLKEGVSVVGGTVLGRLGERSLRFEVRPAGASEPRIDPAPLINGWRQLQHTAIFNPQAATRLAGLGADSTSVGQVLLMSKRELMARVLIDPRITIYACGRRDVETGQIDRRVLAALEFLADSNLYPTVSALKCGHGILTASGNVSEHSTGDAVDIAAINGTPIYQHQGPGSITETTIRRLLQLQGVMKPHQIISLMTFPGADNTLALPDHYDHIHVGYHPSPGTVLPSGDPSLPVGDAEPSQLTASQWQRLMTRLSQIGNPHVPTTASKYALTD